MRTYSYTPLHWPSLVPLCLLFLLLSAFATLLEAKLPILDGQKTTKKIDEILAGHANQKKITPELMKRIYVNFIEELDPNKSYFIRSDIERWLNPTDEQLQQSIQEYKEGNFSTFFEIRDEMVQAIEKRKKFEKKLDYEQLPKKVNPKEFKDLDWVDNDEQLFDRLEKIRALQTDAAKKLDDDVKEKALQRLQKYRSKNEEEIANTNKDHERNFVLSKVLKATATSLDSHTAYFTPDEATQFLINVEQRLFGIGAQLRDDINGFTNFNNT